MRHSDALLLAGLTMLSVFLLSAVYAFVLQELIAWILTGAFEERAASERWRDVLTTTSVAAIALITPILVSRRSISGRTLTEEERSEGELDYQAITQTAQDAIIFADEKGTIISCNRVAEAMFGYDGEEMFGEPLTMLMPERHRKAHTNGLARVSAGGEPRIIGSTVELSGLRDDGQEFPLELSLSTWSTDRRRGYTGILRDITERKRKEEALRQSEERLRKLVETAPDAVVVVDFEGKIVAWNPGARDIFGYEEHEVIGANVTTLMPERYRKKHEAGMKRLRNLGETRLIGKTASLHGLCKDGSEFPLELSLGTWSAGKETFFSAIIRDIAKRNPANKVAAG
ncbi:MAG: PAS domain S-box protein [Nitrospirota bacterium]|nr:PAS domain S-box protein [Nitrospirota bacterium]